MLISTLKISSLFLLLLFVPIICCAEDDSAPPKFYDGLPIEIKKSSQPHANQDKNDDAEVIEQKPKLKTPPRHKEIAAQNSVSEPSNSTSNSKQKDDEFDTHIVGKNETLFSISQHFKVDIAQLAAWNAITSPKQLYLGQKLKIFKNKQKHSDLKSTKNSLESAKISRDDSQKTSIISINNKSMLKFYCHWPAKGKITRNFPQTGNRGIEINGKAGQAIRATAEGKVVAVNPAIYGHGIFIVIEHADEMISSYANNRRALVKTGQSVAQGQKIAEMGQVGRKLPSLEFEIRKSGVLVNPMLCLPKKI